MKPADLAALGKLKTQLQAARVTPEPVALAPVAAAPVDFAAQLQGVRRLAQEPVAPVRRSPALPKASALARRAAAEGSQADAAVPLSDLRALLHPVGSEAFLSWRVPTLPKRILDQLREGKLPWSEAVDLHGCTVEEARDGVLELLALARRWLRPNSHAPSVWKKYPLYILLNLIFLAAAWLPTSWHTLALLLALIGAGASWEIEIGRAHV